MRTPVILLACGCFNPPTNMHLRMFEIARDYLHRMGAYEVIGGIISPVHDGYGKKELVSSTHRVNMIRTALHGNDWVKLSDWEVKQECWTTTRQILQYHQNHVNAYLHSDNNIDINEDELKWMPDNIKKRCGDSKGVTVKLLCGADLLESFGTPGLWADEDMEAIVGQHGLVVITRCNGNPSEFIYNSDMLTKYMANILIVTEWIRNEVSSTKIRRALRRSESVKYLIADKVIDYIHKHGLYGADKTKYLTPIDITSSIFLTPSSDIEVTDSPSPTNCLYICNNNLFNKNSSKFDRMSVGTIESFRSHTQQPLKATMTRHPGQAVKIVTESSGDHRIIGKTNKTSLERAACL
ncbi:nicotinamide/nicotinic acid mononucleotide adenylyltransferase 3 isoform X2 [Anthonomus grandis grandis]|uniref:nicotinamide/nicotinic acid mononucleotide adenylyltransferase 3 isoform X2 n=1 Tax=Anthonomus grandis grandis TaxID=2921223 RepID=UPI00216667D8|nr:nicotinamide/nicotinic acid mononucleotide adenylyltransferase 3 isoform X2 [Anthonomus grandis grandis]